jgi:hypothetical protein
MPFGLLHIVPLAFVVGVASRPEGARVSIAMGFIPWIQPLISSGAPKVATESFGEVGLVARSPFQGSHFLCLLVHGLKPVAIITVSPSGFYIQNLSRAFRAIHKSSAYPSDTTLSTSPSGLHTRVFRVPFGLLHIVPSSFVVGAASRPEGARVSIAMGFIPWIRPLISSGAPKVATETFGEVGLCVRSPFQGYQSFCLLVHGFKPVAIVTVSPSGLHIQDLSRAFRALHRPSAYPSDTTLSTSRASTQGSSACPSDLNTEFSACPSAAARAQNHTRLPPPEELSLPLLVP